MNPRCRRTKGRFHFFRGCFRFFCGDRQALVGAAQLGVRGRQFFVRICVFDAAPVTRTTFERSRALNATRSKPQCGRRCAFSRSAPTFSAAWLGAPANAATDKRSNDIYVRRRNTKTRTTGSDKR